MPEFVAISLGWLLDRTPTTADLELGVRGWMTLRLLRRASQSSSVTITKGAQGYDDARVWKPAENRREKDAWFGRAWRGAARH